VCGEYLLGLLQSLLPGLLRFLRKNCTLYMPVSDLALVRSATNLLDCQLSEWQRQRPLLSGPAASATAVRQRCCRFDPDAVCLTERTEPPVGVDGGVCTGLVCGCRVGQRPPLAV
jgi:hypothetical protein